MKIKNLIIFILLLGVLILGFFSIKFYQEKNVAQNQLSDVAVTKSLVDYYKMKDQFKNDSMKEKPNKYGLTEVAKVKTACSINFDGPCGFDLLILSKQAIVEDGIQEFYLAMPGGAYYTYYGPFTDNLKTIVEESVEIESLK